MRDLYHRIKNSAIEVGFDLCGIAPVATLTPQKKYLDEWIAKGNNGTMGWMAANGDKREEITTLVEGAKTVIVCALSYLSLESVNGISRFALGTDYHYVIKSMLEKIASSIHEQVGREFGYRVFCDSAPLFERHWAQMASLGWIGRNKMLINRDFGSYILLGELVCDIELERYDSEDPFNGCGNCHHCIDSCPGAALSEQGLDARSCVSYLTIEHSGDFSTSQREAVSKSGYYFGCDICLDICPWNVKARAALSPQRSDKAATIFDIYNSQTPLTPQQWQLVIERGFRSMFKGRSMLRAGKRKMVRNLALE